MLRRYLTYAIVFLTLLPMLVILIMSFTSASYVSFPPPGFSLQGYAGALSKPAFFTGLVRSLWIALLTGAIATVLGTSVAMGLVRYRFRGRDLAQAVFMSPLVMPQVVIGIAMLQFFSRIGLASSALCLVIGHVVITIPFAIRLVGISVRGFDGRLELAAQSLGASPYTAFTKITLPLIQTGIWAAYAFTFVTSFDNVTISVFLATPTFSTFPVLVYDMLAQPLEPWLVALCSLVMAWTALLIVIIQRVIGVQGLFAGTTPGEDD
jgi:putative spermidine/putrescine transport system permease protein